MSRKKPAQPFTRIKVGRIYEICYNDVCVELRTVHQKVKNESYWKERLNIGCSQYAYIMRMIINYEHSIGEDKAQALRELECLIFLRVSSLDQILTSQSYVDMEVDYFEKKSMVEKDNLPEDLSPEELEQFKQSEIAKAEIKRLESK